MSTTELCLCGCGLPLIDAAPPWLYEVSLRDDDAAEILGCLARLAIWRMWEQCHLPRVWSLEVIYA